MLFAKKIDFLKFLHGFPPLSVKISRQSDEEEEEVSSLVSAPARYRGFGEATFVIFKTMDKKEFRVLIKHSFFMGKILLKQSSGLINVMATLHKGTQQSSTGMMNLNAVVQTPMTLNALVAQNQQLFRKT